FSLLRDLFDAEQVARPKLLVLTDPPLVDLADRHDVERVHALPALFACVDESDIAQHVNVLHDPEAREVRKSVDDLGRRPRTLAQQVENRAAGRVGERFPDRVEVVWLHVHRAAVLAAQSCAIALSACCHPVLTPSRCAGSMKPIARCRSASRVPPAISSSLTSRWLIAG